ncbi:MAG: transposase, partial [candidate division KSB1 bacterium]|nr:transposase [candidate division KSB1 bacterium]
QGTRLEPWLLITDWPVTDAESARRIFQMYRQRWAVEDSFKFTKDCLGWEEVQLLDLNGIRTLVALAWVAAGFLYEMGITLEWPEVQLLARLGGWVARQDRKPGKIIITRGLRRLMDMLTTEAFLDHYVAEYGTLPPRIAALLGRPASRSL